jgi:hypothetical protein
VHTNFRGLLSAEEKQKAPPIVGFIMFRGFLEEQG